MAKSKKQFMEILEQERYLIWAIVFSVMVAVMLVTQISIANIQMDTEILLMENFENFQ